MSTEIRDAQTGELVAVASETLIESTEKAAADVDDLERWIAELPDLPTEELVSGFVSADAFVKKVGKFTDAVKKELVTNAKGDMPASGRFLEEAEVDEKGHRYLEGANGERLQAQKRVSTRFDPERAEAVLKDYDLWEYGTDEVESVASLDEVKQTMDELNKAIDALIADGADEEFMGEMRRLVETLVKTERQVSEEKIESLVVLEELPPDTVELLMDTTVTYAVIAPKK